MRWRPIASRLHTTACLTTSSKRPSAALPTIFAPASPPVKSAIAILRVSGPDALHVWHKMTLSPGSMHPSRSPPAARKAVLRRIVHPTTRETLDDGLVLFFPKESSLTSQPLVELHVHGSPPLLRTLTDALASLGPSFRLAEPGEFTRLAFEAGKMDLTEVEGLRDLIDATTEQQRRLATRQATGSVSKVYNEMQQALIDATALIEAVIDFGEDQGIDDNVLSQAFEKTDRVVSLIQTHLSRDKSAEIIRSGVSLAIIGAPNAGKSTLFNWLAQRDAAIVSPVAGTTRDVLELSLDINGYPVKVLDTAGLRDTSDIVEQIGVERAKARANEADLRVCILSLPDVFNGPEPVIDNDTLDLIDNNTLILLNKIDLVPHLDRDTTIVDEVRRSLKRRGKSFYGQPITASVSQQSGMTAFQQLLGGALQDRYSFDEEEWPIITQQRHRDALEECLAYLDAFKETCADDVVLGAEELRYASHALAKITGAVDTETILGQIFAGFCIGK